MGYRVTSNQVANNASLLDQSKPFIHVAWQKMLVYILRSNIACYRPPFRLLLTFQIPVIRRRIIPVEVPEEEATEVTEETATEVPEEEVAADVIEAVAAMAEEAATEGVETAVIEETTQRRRCLGPRKDHRQCELFVKKTSSGVFCHHHTKCEEDMEELDNWSRM
ncbi:hypothetical protein A0J61_02317 [Choanephora cucurbitarum]|uniref:Uncharacterized protein n=1 Tax=Choanephora cucurbitarum TaxID=101091 RepID=A0A1C7NQT8_9FUNG|nr:hypothetical protein A0J61_02317 [Choanephora cucurbitarum]